MRYIIETGTDAATLCFFDPAALPSDFDKQTKADTVSTFEKLNREGRLWWENTEGDGGYRFHFYVNDEVPTSMLQHASDPQNTERFLVPGGTMWACGAEYVACNPSVTLARFAHMGGSFNIQPGEYSVTRWHTDWPDGLLDEALAKRVGHGVARRFNRLGQLAGFLFLVSIAATLIVFMLTVKRPAGLVWYWVGLIILWVISWGLLKTVLRWEKNPIKREVEQEYPDFVVRMRLISAS